jgi:hypothetical protein
MASPLLVNSESFRKKIVVKNLVPYTKSPSRTTPPINYESYISDLSVKDSPDELIDNPTYANELYAKNQYGAEGGYKQVPDPSALLNSKSNEGEYGPFQQDAKIIDQGYIAAQKGFAGVSPAWKPLNPYANGLTIIDSAEAFSSLNIVYPNGGRTPNGQPYPTTFVPSSYNPVSILLSRDPQGSNGLLSSDSYIARLGATVLRKEFETRIATQIRRNTIGRANIFNTRSGTDLLNIVTGRVPLIEPDYRITAPANPVLAATDFALRLAGSILPVSPIVGSYFDPSINSGLPTTIQQISNAFRRTQVGKFFSRVLGFGNTGSELFLNNTGGGQKSRLFDNIDYNRYKPNYNRTILDRLGGAIVGTSVSVSNYYIGSITSDPSRILSPSGDVPVDNFAREIAAPVYGPSEIAELYEGPSREIKLGANGPTYSDGGGIEGGFTWVSPKYKGNAGKKVGIGGEITNIDENFRPSSYNSTESTNYEFREGSILDDTQRIIDSQPSGGRRLKHVGNAIDQVSKVFNDGYKELTKGSQVIKYTGAIGQEVGTEYCRVFSKDTPYLQYNDLQKVNGITTHGRKIASSVLDNTYNLNIYPNRKDSAGNSTNLYGNSETGKAKKYMFSLENLAWRTSSKPGYTVADLPICERGPNGGRVMWFPPYALTFSETSTPNFNQTDFLGRPEPIYTYRSTTRTGSISWKIVVDHPSVLNLIVNKVMSDETNNERITGMIESFFAGCLKYDLYELAKKYPLANPNELYLIQNELNQRKLSKEQVQGVKETLVTGNNSPKGEENVIASNPDLENNNISRELSGIAFYFENEEPNSGESYETAYQQYITRKPVIVEQSPSSEDPYKTSPEQVSSFFDNVIQWNYEKIKTNLNKIYQGFNSGNYEKLVINLAGTTSSSSNNSYNRKLNTNRIESVKNYILGYKPTPTDKTIGDIAKNKITFYIAQENTNAIVKSNNGYCESYICGSKDTKKTDTSSINTVYAMACRRISIESINITPKTDVARNASNSTGPTITTNNGTPVETVNRELPPVGLSKQVLRLLLSECDYFEAIKEDSPLVYDNLKEKLKFFNPAFHSITPEGLNSRLTFLQQCVRPGETIPVVKVVNGKSELQYNNATNSAFGTPPVLVLRIGDFYNTKIIPTSLALKYESLDLNPEGIGVQPMIADVTMNFNFVGGSGIQQAVEKLQNALSFNFYANTEIYDERAEVTDKKSLEEYDKEFYELYVPAPPTTNQVQNEDGQKNGGTIGEILTREDTESGTTGTISYTKFYNTLSDSTQSYFRNVINKNKEVLSQYNESIRQIFTLGRNYTNGKILGTANDEGFIFGKPGNFQSNIDEIFKDLASDIQNGSDKFMTYLSTTGLSNKAIRVIKTNYKNYILQKKSTFINPLTKIIQDFTLIQQNYAIDIAKMNIITYGDTDGSVRLSGTDGFQEKNNNVVVYYTSGATSLKNMVEDGTIIKDSLNQFSFETTKSFVFGKDDLKNILVRPKTQKFKPNAIFLPVTKNSDLINNTNVQREYTILNKDVIDVNKYNAFKSFIIDDIINNISQYENGNTNISTIFDDYWEKQMRPIFQSEDTAANEFIDYLEKNELKDFVNYTKLKNQKDKTLSFSNIHSVTEDALINNRKTLIGSLGKSTNSNTNKNTFNDDEGGLNIVKVKFN